MRLTRGALYLCGLLMIPLATGCSSNTEDYCGALEDNKRGLSDLAQGASEPGATLFADSLGIFEDLRGRAPDDVVDEWDTFVFAWEGLAEAFAEAGVSPKDYQPGQTSGTVSQAQAQAIEDAARELGAPRVVAAGDGIEQHARDVCKVDLGL